MENETNKVFRDIIRMWRFAPAGYQKQWLDLKFRKDALQRIATQLNFEQFNRLSKNSMGFVEYKAFVLLYSSKIYDKFYHWLKDCESL